MKIGVLGTGVVGETLGICPGAPRTSGLHGVARHAP